jgi:uncharacterized membrane protein YeiB
VKRFISAVAILLVPALLVIGPAAFAEDEEDMKRQAQGQMQQAQMQQMQEMMGLMMGQMLEGMGKSMAKKEFAENVATFTRNYYEALIARGFTEEQALRIVEASGIPNYATKR